MTVDIPLTYVDHVYNLVLMNSLELDSIYQDYIEHLVGVCGFNVLYSARLLESCGVINGRRLFVLVCREGN